MVHIRYRIQYFDTDSQRWYTLNSVSRLSRAELLFKDAIMEYQKFTIKLSRYVMDGDIDREMNVIKYLERK
jgi:hypothetical protein